MAGERLGSLWREERGYGGNKGEANLLNAPLLKSQRGASTLCPWVLLWDDAALPLITDERCDTPSNGALKTWGLGSVPPVASCPARTHD